MTAQPPSPYGPGPGSPYGPPPGPPPQRRGMSNKAMFWIGFALALPAFVLAGFLSGLAGSVVGALAPSSQLGSMLSGLAGLAELAGLVALIVIPRTRWLGLGLLAGFMALLIVAAGACILLIAALTSAYN